VDLPYQVTVLRPFPNIPLSDFAVQWYAPPGVSGVDIVMLGGGGGGEQAGLADGKGGGAGGWKAISLVSDGNAGGDNSWDATLPIIIVPGTGGRGGLEFSNNRTNGIGGIAAWNYDPESEDSSGISSLYNDNSGGSASSGNRNGVPVVPFTFNGRTYLGGAGGNGTATPGANGQVPGGGGQGGKPAAWGAGYGGNGADGAIYLWVY